VFVPKTAHTHTHTISMLSIHDVVFNNIHKQKQTPWPESVNELYRPSDRHLSENLVSTFADKECRVVSAADPLRQYSRLSRPESLLFLQSSSYCTHEAEWTPFRTHYLSENLIAPGMEPGTSGSVAKNSDHRGGIFNKIYPTSCPTL
jgi:hypothetical protein